MEKLSALKAKIDDHKKHLDELEKHVYVRVSAAKDVHAEDIY